jgi:membrane-associated protein
VLEHWVLALTATPWVYLVMFLFATIDGFFPPIPSESVVIALAATAISAGTPDLTLVLVSAAAGAFAGDQAAYWIGSRVNVRRVRFFQSEAAQRTLAWASQALNQRGASFIIAARYIPVGRVAVNMMAGSLGYPRRRFVPLAAIGAMTWSLYSAAIGIGAGAWLKGHPMLAIMAGLVGGLVIGVVVDRTIQVVVRRRLGAAKPAGAGAATSEVAKPAGPGVASELAKSHPLHAVVRSLGENQRGA